MKFICPQCHAKYAVGDDKIHRARVKTRCKRCGFIIEITVPAHILRSQDLSPEEKGTAVPDQSPPEQAPTTQLEKRFAGSFRDTRGNLKSPGIPGLFDRLKHSARALEADETEIVQWYVAIADKPVGPISARKVHGYCQTGRVNYESLVWKEGMPDWVAFRSSKDLMGLIAKIDLETSKTAPPQISDEPPKLGWLQQPGQGAPLKGLQVGVIGDLRDTTPDEPAEKPVPAPSTAAAISGGPGATNYAALPEDWDALDSELGTIHPLSPPKPGGNRVYLFASVGFFITAVVTLVVVVFGGSRATGEPQSVKTVEKIVEKVVYRDRLVKGERASLDEGKAESSAAEPATAVKRLTKLRGTTNIKKAGYVDERTRALMERLSGPAGMNTAIGSTPVKRTLSGTKPVAGLSSGQMKNVVDKNKGALKSCYERSLRKGEAPEERDIRVNFKLNVGESGLVRQASLSGEGAELPSLNKCLTLAVQKWVFPPSTGDSVLEFPFVFTPTR